MKARYLFFLIGITLIINVVTILNVGLAYICIFLFMQAGLPRIFLVIEQYAKRKEAEKSEPFTRFLLTYLNHIIIRVINFVSILASLITIIFGSTVIIIVQLLFKREIQEFIYGSIHGGIAMVIQIVSMIGYSIFFLTIIFVIIDSVRLLKKEPLFHV